MMMRSVVAIFCIALRGVINPNAHVGFVNTMLFLELLETLFHAVLNTANQLDDMLSFVDGVANMITQ